MLGRVAGWARPVSYTLGWRVAGWAGPEASRRHVRQPAGGLRVGRLVSGYFETAPKGLVCWMTWGQTRAGGQGGHGRQVSAWRSLRPVSDT